MKTITTAIVMLFSVIAFTQSDKQLAVFAGASYQPILIENQIGASLNARYYIQEKLSAGVDFMYTSEKYSQGFGFDTDRTLMYNLNINSLLQYDVVKNEKFSAGIYVLSGISIVTLRNMNDTKTEEVQTEVDGVWYTYEVEVPRRLDRTTYFIITPGIDASYKLATLDSEFNTNLYLTARLGYQKALGKNAFSKPENFTDAVFSLGVTIKGSL